MKNKKPDKLEQLRGMMLGARVTQFDFDHEGPGTVTITLSNGCRCSVSADGDESAHIVLRSGMWVEETIIQ